MKRSYVKIAKEIGDVLEGKVGKTADLMACKQVPTIWLQRWLLTLAPEPKKRRAPDPRQTERKASIKELDRLCREVVFLRDGGVCRRCGIKPATDWCHVHTRGAHAVRWDLDNSWAGCRGCHMNFWHKQPLEAAAWWEKEIGSKRYEDLRMRANKGIGKRNHAAWKAFLTIQRKEFE